MWPSLFSRYILREVLVLASITLIALTTVIMIGVVMHQLISAGLGLFAFIKMLPYATLFSLQFAVPCSLLFAVCGVYGRMAADNEFIAVKSAGVHPFKVVWPVYVFALIVSPLAVWVNDLAVSKGRPGLNRIVVLSLEEIVYGFLRSNGSYASQNGLKIVVEDVQGRWLIHPTIFIPSGADNNVIIAERLIGTLQSLREASDEHGWQLDWSELDGDESPINVAMKKREFETAIRLLSKKISHVVKQIPKGHGPESSSVFE